MDVGHLVHVHGHARRVGFLLTFVSTAVVGVTYGYGLWRKLGWRMTSEVLFCFGGAFCCVVAYAIRAVFVDPAGRADGRRRGDRLHRAHDGLRDAQPHAQHRRDVRERPPDRARDEAARDERQHGREARAELFATGKSFLQGAAKKKLPATGFHVLLAGCYSIAGSVPGFEYADAMASAAGDLRRARARARARNMRAKYLVLVLYVAIAYWQTKWWQLAIINTPRSSRWTACTRASAAAASTGRRATRCS